MYTGFHKIITHEPCVINYNSKWKNLNVCQVMGNIWKILCIHRMEYGIWHEPLIHTAMWVNLGSSDGKEVGPISNDAMRIKQSQYWVTGLEINKIERQWARPFPMALPPYQQAINWGWGLGLQNSGNWTEEQDGIWVRSLVLDTDTLNCPESQ